MNGLMPASAVLLDRRQTTRAASTRLDRWLLARVQRLVETSAIRFELWDGFAVPETATSPVATIHFNSRSALLAWVRDPELNFGEGYMSCEVEIRGDLEQLLEVTYRALIGRRRSMWPRDDRNDAARSKLNVHHHYDLGNDFYRLWLDSGGLHLRLFQIS
jgi:cyclopropane-fatty-acyl-phospholipid synthase